MNIFIQSSKPTYKGIWWFSSLIFFFWSFLICSDANASQNYYEGKDAEKIIKSGELQEKINEEDHTHLILEYMNNVFWCTVEKDGNKICTEY